MGSGPSRTKDQPPSKVRKDCRGPVSEIATNSSHRKRAKTEDEKEQRRVERVLRNRRAAQSSRERKRQEVEALEKKNQELVDKLDKAHHIIEELLQKLGSSGASSSFDALRPNPITFSQELFNSQDGHMASQTTTSSLMDGILMTSQSSNTVNPASLSPTLCPVPEEDEEEWLAQNEASTTAAPVDEAPATTEETSPDATQLPAAKLCSDLQCRSAEAPPQSQLTASVQQQLWLFQTLLFPLQLLILSACQRPLLQVAMSMRAGFSLPPTPAILNTIIWFVTTRRHTSREAANTTTSTSPSSSQTISTSPLPASANSSSTVPATAQAPASRSPTLRLRSLRRILSCSPHLARPLKDATLEVLRLVVSKKTLDVDMVDGADWPTTDADDGSSSPQQRQQPEEEIEYLKYVPEFQRGRLPSMEALFTLAWICEVELQKSFKKQHEIRSTYSGVKQREAVVTKQESRIPDLVMPDIKADYHTWEAERRLDFDPNPRLME